MPEEQQSRETKTESTGTYAGQRADVVISRHTEVRPDLENDGGEIEEEVVMIQVKYDGFDGIAAFPYHDVDHVLSDLTDNHYQRQILTERRDQAGVDMDEQSFADAITQVEADAEAIIRREFSL